MTPDRWFDLLLNFLSELFGILVTVFLVDEIIKSREKTRWKPTKDLVYYRLTEIVSKIFIDFSPLSLHEEIVPVMLSFGSFTTGLVKDFSSVDLGFFELDPLLTKELDRVPLGYWLEDQHKLLIESYRIINVIINDSATFLEPEVLSLVFQLKDSNNRFLSFVLSVHDP